MQSRNRIKQSSYLLLICLLTSCGSDRPDGDGMYDSGFSDGYATGYNTTCQIRATLINDYDDENYRRGYNDGYIAGSDDCRRSRE